MYGSIYPYKAYNICRKNWMYIIGLLFEKTDAYICFKRKIWNL